MIRKPRIVVVGRSCADVTHFLSPRKFCSEAAHLPTYEMVSGNIDPGMAANVAANVASYRPDAINVHLVTSMDDEVPYDSRVRERLSSLGVFLHVAQLPMSVRERWRSNDGQLLQRVDNNVPSGTAHLPPLASMFREISADVAIAAPYEVGNYWPSVCQAMMNVPSPPLLLVDPRNDVWARWLALRPLAFVPNERELYGADITSDSVGPDTHVETAAKSVFRRADLPAIIVKRGASGLMMVSKSPPSVRYAKSPLLELSDPTGAGDSVIAVLACLLARAVVVQGPLTSPVACSVLHDALLPAVSAGYVAASRCGTTLVSERDVRSVRTKVRCANTIRGTILANGCFDLLHAGHLHLLAAARALDPYAKLLVAVNSDEDVRRLKGRGRPFLSLRDRVRLLRTVRGVDDVATFSGDFALIRLIKAVQPAYLVKGSEYGPGKVFGEDLLSKWGGSVVRVPMLPGISTTSLAASDVCCEQESKSHGKA